jgi:hypothetical protein
VKLAYTILFGLPLGLLILHLSPAPATRRISSAATCMSHSEMIAAPGSLT